MPLRNAVNDTVVVGRATAHTNVPVCTTVTTKRAGVNLREGAAARGNPEASGRAGSENEVVLCE